MNPHALRHVILSHACLPVPALPLAGDYSRRRERCKAAAWHGAYGRHTTALARVRDFLGRGCTAQGGHVNPFVLDDQTHDLGQCRRPEERVAGGQRPFARFEGLQPGEELLAGLSECGDRLHRALALVGTLQHPGIGVDRREERGGLRQDLLSRGRFTSVSASRRWHTISIEDQPFTGSRASQASSRSRPVRVSRAARLPRRVASRAWGDRPGGGSGAWLCPSSH